MAGKVLDQTSLVKPQESWRENLNMQLMCPDCKEYPPNLVEEFSSGDMVCGSCGLVLGDRIVDTRSEWRTFSNDDQGNDDPSRVGDAPNALLNGSQLVTSIGFGDGANSKSRELHRAQNKATHDKATKGLLTAYKEVGTLCDAIGIPKNVSDVAKHLFKMVHDANAFKGKSQETIIAGCIFIACRQCKVDRTFREIFALTKVTKAEIGRIFKSLEKFFAAQNEQKLKEAFENGGKFSAFSRFDDHTQIFDFQGGYNQEVDLYKTTQSTDPKELCARFCNQLNLSFQVTTVSQEIADRMDKAGMLAGRSPLSVAAACIYTASHFMNQGKTPKEISSVAGVSDGTIRNAYKLIYPRREKLINPDWLVKGKGGIVGDLKNLPLA